MDDSVNGCHVTVTSWIFCPLCFCHMGNEDFKMVLKNFVYGSALSEVLFISSVLFRVCIFQQVLEPCLRV